MIIINITIHYDKSRVYLEYRNELKIHYRNTMILTKIKLQYKEYILNQYESLDRKKDKHDKVNTK